MYQLYLIVAFEYILSKKKKRRGSESYVFISVLNIRNIDSKFKHVNLSIQRKIVIKDHNQCVV